MGIILGERSLARLAGVHPSLVRVVKRAAEMATPDLDFTVLEGVRSREQMAINYGKGRTVNQCIAKNVPAKYAEPGQAKITWLDNPYMSNHRKYEDGYGHAVDLAPYPIDWTNFARFRKLGELVERAAADCGVAIRWGGRWEKIDLPHFEMAP